MKSCKTQTCLAPPLSLPLGPPQRHDIISSSHLTSADPTDSYTVPMAIPLGQYSNMEILLFIFILEQIKQLNQQNNEKTPLPRNPCVVTLIK